MVSLLNSYAQMSLLNGTATQISDVAHGPLVFMNFLYMLLLTIVYDGLIRKCARFESGHIKSQQFSVSISVFYISKTYIFSTYFTDHLSFEISL